MTAVLLFEGLLSGGRGRVPVVDRQVAGERVLGLAVLAALRAGVAQAGKVLGLRTVRTNIEHNG